MKLIITEKPSVAFDVAKGIGGKIEKKDGYLEVGDYCITWCYGHLLEIDDSIAPNKWEMESLPIIPQKFSYRPIKSRKKQLETIKKLVKEAEEIYNFGDAGREGELLIRLVLQYAGLKDWSRVKRLWTSLSLTPAVVRKELQNLKPASQFDSLYYSALARQHADWIVGINLTRLVTLLASDRSVWSVGRVQTPVLKLIVNREIERKNFKPEDYAVISAQLEKDGSQFPSYLSYDFLVERGELKEGELLKKEKAREILSSLKNVKEAVVVSVKRKRKKEPPPLLHSLTSLQKEANKLWGYSADRVLKAAQKLYEDYKVISYPRTDSNYLGTANKSLVKSVLEKLLSSRKAFSKLTSIAGKVADALSPACLDRVDRAGKRVFDDSKLTDHHAVIPLGVLSKEAGEVERRIYSLILRRFVGAFLDNFVYDEVKAELKLGDYLFISQGKNVVSLGWRVLYSSDFTPLPELAEGEKVSVRKLTLEEKQTQPPPRYSEGSLIDAMKKLNLGTPATRASIIETLKERSYVFVSKKSLIPTEKAFKLIETLRDSKVSSPEMTGEWEKQLDAIYTQKLGRSGYRNFYSDVCSFVREEVENLKQKKIDSKPQATKKMLQLARKLSKQIGRKLPATDFETVKSFIDSALKEVKQKQENGICSCRCGGKVIPLGNKGWKCEKCGKVVWRQVFRKYLTEKQAEKLFKGERVFVKGLVSKRSKKFSAYLKLTDEGVKLEFE